MELNVQIKKYKMYKSVYNLRHIRPMSMDTSPVKANLH